MDPFTAIIAALSTGVITGATTGTARVVETALMDAYNGLKATIKRKVGDNSEVVKAINTVEQDPNADDGRQEMLKETLKHAGVDQDPEVRKAAERLGEQANQLARGHHIAQADHGSTAIVASYEYAPPSPVERVTLEDASRRLADMPLDVLPDPAPLPHGSVMPLSHNPLFVGREEELKTLAKKLKGGDITTIGHVAMAAATGLGGIGKTQLASEFVHRYGQYFAGGVFWLSFADPNAIRAEVAACGGAGAMELRPDFRVLHVEDQVREVMSAWQSELPRLLVFDDCEDEELLVKWQPPTGSCWVLVTSRRERWSQTLGVRTLPLDVLSREESISLLREYRPELPADDPDLDAIAEKLGDLPLALELAGSYLASYRHAVTPAGYLRQLVSSDLLQHRSLLRAREISPTRHSQDVARTFALSYERLNTEDPVDVMAIMLLARAACFAPGEPIPRDLLRTTLSLSDEDPDAPFLAENALGRFAELSMLQEQEKGALRMHQLVAAFVSSEAADDRASRAVEEALADTVSSLIAEGYPSKLVALLPHLRVVTDTAKERDDERAALLCMLLGDCFRTIGTYGEARPYLERAAAINEKVLGEEHTNTATSLNDLANVLYHQGHYEEARSLYERVLAVREKMLGQAHPDTASSLNSLGKVLSKQGLYEDARERHEQALGIYEKALGEDNPDIASSLNNLANVLYNQGHYEEARPLYERALQIRTKVLGTEHPDTAGSLNNLANLLGDRGLYEEAGLLYERALQIREKALGKEHPDTASSLNNLANVLYNQGHYEEARPLYERALQIRTKVLGAEHLDTERVRENIGDLNAQQDA